MFRLASLSIALATGVLGVSSVAWAQDQSPAFSWTLPKTVLDVTITYEYTGCVLVGNSRQYRIKVTPLIAARGIPDPETSLRAQSTGDLKAGWQDRNMTITTFANSHILSSVSAHPVSEAATIVSNVLGGIGKIVGIAIGGGFGPLLDVKETDCPDDADNPGHQIKYYKDQIQLMQAKLAGDNVSDTQQKQYTAQVQALQTLLQQEQAKMSFSIKATIDPGYTDPQKVQVGSDASPAGLFPSRPPQGSPKLGAVPQNGLIASLIPTAVQMKGVPWIKDPGGPIAAGLRIKMYMDFKHAIPPKVTEENYYLPTIVGSHPNAITYRDVAYIPVLVWLGDDQDKNAQLLANNRLPFAQYGQEQILPLGAGAFADVSWSITFSEIGEETNSSFTSKSLLVSASGLFTPLASTASSISTGIQSSNANEATALQNQADAIYQSHRLAVCQANPANCPSK